MKPRFFLVTLFVLSSFISFSQTSKAPVTADKPKLVVGIVMDQMRWDFLYKYDKQYSTGGFKRLLNQGFTCENNFIPYMPTYTAPGHTCIYTGSVPAIHGIAGNNWYDKNLKREVYCTEDSSVNSVGGSEKAGKMSPKNMWTTTITDELRLSNNFKSKVIGIALKDRGAILPAGHSANAAYWYDAGKWITSDFYMKDLPEWVKKVNAEDRVSKLMSKDWNTILPINQYTLSTSDDKVYEENIKGLKSPTFPHALSTLTDTKYDAFRTTPFANTYTFDFAKDVIENENMGKNSVPDFLTISISSTDYIGHSFGPNSIEMQDTYIRLDREVASFLQYLDTKIGKGNYTVFLTADHGVAHIPDFLKENKMPAGIFNDNDIQKSLNAALEKKFGVTKVVSKVINYQVYLNDEIINDDSISRDKAIACIIHELKKLDYVVTAFETEEIMEASLPETLRTMVINGYNPKRSGDIQFMVKPGYFDGRKKGTTHGLWNPYDSHIPFVLYGWGIKPGKTYRETYMTDIAPTLAALLKIQMPNGTIGKVVYEAFK